jgi:hypothetical protein
MAQVPAIFSALSYEGMYGVGAAVTFLGKTRTRDKISS